VSIEWSRTYRKSSSTEESENKKGNERESEQPRTHFEDPIERKRGDGAQSKLDDKRDARKLQNQSNFSRVQTTLYAEESRKYNIDSDDVRKPNLEEFYNRMWKHHHGWHDDSTGRREKKDKVAMTQSLADEFPITKWEMKSAVHLVLKTNGRKFNRYGGLEALVLGAISYIREREISSGNFDHMNVDQRMNARIVGSDKYDDLCDKHNVDGSKAHKQIKRVTRDG